MRQCFGESFQQPTGGLFVLHARAFEVRVFVMGTVSILVCICTLCYVLEAQTV
jgi:hypothetical protein